jgi:hypothetical protein
MTEPTDSHSVVRTWLVWSASFLAFPIAGVAGGAGTQAGGCPPRRSGWAPD